MWNTIMMVSLLAMCGAGLNAQITVKAYKTAMESSEQDAKDAMNFYTSGIGDGFTWVNVSLKDQLYCQPKKLALNSGNYTHIIDKAIVELLKKPLPADVDLDNMPISGLLLHGLQQMFPCPKDKRVQPQEDK